MDDDIQTLIDMVNAELCGELLPLAMAYRIPYNELLKEINEVKVSELIYDKLTESVWVYIAPVEGMVIWVLPKRR